MAPRNRVGQFQKYSKKFDHFSLVQTLATMEVRSGLLRRVLGVALARRRRRAVQSDWPPGWLAA